MLMTALATSFLSILPAEGEAPHLAALIPGSCWYMESITAAADLGQKTATIRIYS